MAHTGYVLGWLIRLGLAWLGLAWLGVARRLHISSFFYVLVARPFLVILVFVDASLASWLSAQHQKRFAVCLWDL